MGDMIIYKATNLINGKAYIGQTQQGLEVRRSQHLRDLGRCGLGRAIRKHGDENFKWEILCECSTQEELNWMEIEMIREHGTLAPNGYNLTTGGDAFEMSDETRKAMSKGQRESPFVKANAEAQRGKKLSPEHRKAISEANKNNPENAALCRANAEANKDKPLSPEHRKKISEAKKGKPIHPLSTEHRKAISEGLMGKPLSPEHRKAISEALQKSPSVRAKAEAQKGKPLSPERRKKISEAQKDKPKPPLSPEHLKALSEGRARYWERKIAERNTISPR